jgi:asparaginyl-tRNA synthetase
MLIKDLSNFVNKEVTLKGWVANRRDGKGLVFINLRDGSGQCQCIGDEKLLGAEKFEAAASLGLESSVILTGMVVADERQIGGYELHISDVNVLQNVKDYPIAKKEHGIDFLMDQRHLWVAKQSSMGHYEN